jgi:signal transduction histidine kinase/CheY-like chemotaxis protein
MQRTEIIHAEQTRLLYANAPAGFVATVVNAVLLALIQWPVIAPPHLVTWLAAMLALTALRAGLVWRFQRRAPQAIGRWGTLFGLGTLGAGLGWGSAGVWLFPVASLTHQVFLAFVLGGMIAGAVGLLSARLGVFLSFACPAAVPIIVHLLAQGDTPSRTMGAMATLFTLVIVFTAWKLHCTIRTSLHLRFDNVDLVAAVTAEKARVEHLNTDLTAEITERQRAEAALQTAQEALEERVQARTAELATTLEQLQAEMVERQSLAEELRQVQKMEAVGRLAGGIAHDFNNLLTVIIGRSELVLAHLPSGDERRQDLELIQTTAHRAAALTEQLLAFSRRQLLQPMVIDLHMVIGNVVPMLRRLISEDIAIHTVAGATGRVKVDPGQIEQVLVNLAVNARDAMPQGGRLVISTANAVLDEDAVGRIGGILPGPYLILSVADTGLGMDDETRPRGFEPFFTTKPQGKGTGLGLSMVYGIVQQHGGTIRVESAPGQGATFTIYLPRVDDPVSEVESSVASDAAGRGSETILVVEDETPVRALVAEMLQASGYTVLMAADPAAALELSDRHPGPIHLLLTDVVMPEMSGPELRQRLKSLRPRTRVLYMSGYTDEALGRHGVLEPGTFLLQKPFSIGALGQKVREVLDVPA